MRPVDKDNPPIDIKTGLAKTFNKYSHARRDLINTIGDYCSYCERHISVGIAVEHIEPKSILKNAHLKLAWSNFLLGCVNCNSTKGTKDIVLDEYFWADNDNTYAVFAYDKSGLVKVSSQLTNAQDIIKAKNTIILTGLDKIPPNEGTVEWEEASDNRVTQRIQAFMDAKEEAEEYFMASFETRKSMLRSIRKIVLGTGFWSIWMRAFENFPEVQKELINSFKGTRCEFF